MSDELKQVKKFELNEEAKVLFHDLKTVLMDNIQKVQADEHYINQARSINSSVNSVIKLAKLQFDLMRFDSKQQKLSNGTSDIK